MLPDFRKVCGLDMGRGVPERKNYIILTKNTEVKLSSFNFVTLKYEIK